MDNPINQTPESISDVASRLQAVIETAVDGIITIDERGIIEFANPSTCKIFQYEVAEMIGKNISMLMPSPYHENHDGYMHNYMSTGVKKIIGIGREVRGKKKDGTIFPFWLSVSEVKLESKRRMFTGIVHDMTEQKKAEEDLLKLNQDLESIVAERTEKLSDVVNKLLSTNQQLQHEIQERKVAEQALLLSQEALKNTQEGVEKDLRAALNKERELGELKSRFVSMASHEFRTPLSTILSSASLSAQYTLTEQQDKREKHYQKIKSSVTSLTGILNDFLSLSRLEEGRVETHFEDVDFSIFCMEMAEEINPILRQGQHIFVKHSHESMVLQMDKKLMKMILINLLTNASKYSDEGAEINCIVKKDNNALEIDIIDHGIGIPEEDKPHMFDRFFRASNAMNIKGTGLGLNIVKRYVELMGGTIKFKSELGKGSTFTVSFKG
jgi:two-component system, LuxR family, sensor kinase FixL